MRFSRLLPPLFLLAILAFFVTNALLLDSTSLAFVRSSNPRDTLVGLPEPRFFTDPDSYAWLCHTRDMLLSGNWRIRHTHMDNAPYGRPMHWSHLLIWELAAHAKLLQHLHPDMLLSPALEIAGRCAMPFFFLIFIPPLFFVFLRKLGFLPAAVFALSVTVFPLFSAPFSPLRPDHHVFQYLLLLVTVSALTFGGWGHVSSGGTGSVSPPGSFWVRPLVLPSARSASRWFLLAGVAHACLLWIGASVWLVAHCALCLATLSALDPHAADSRPAPQLWISFLATALPLSVAFYLLEYAPRFPGMRLEVNSPLHWLFLAGTVLALSRTASLRDAFSRCGFRGLIVPLLLAAPLPLALAFGPASWHALHDPFLKRLHARHIDEFIPYVSILRDMPFHPVSLFRFFLVPLLFAPILAFWPGMSLSRRTSHQLRPHAVLLLVFLAMLLFQQRWGTLLSAVLILPTLLLLDLGFRAASPLVRRLATAFLVLVLADATWIGGRSVRESLLEARNDLVPSTWVPCDLAKRAALRLAVASAGRDWILAGDAANAPLYYYFGGIPSVASYYWENAVGWHAEAPLFAAPADALPSELLAAARDRGISRILVNHASNYPLVYQYVATGMDDPESAYRRTLLGALHCHPAIPVPQPFSFDPTLTESISRTNLYALPNKGTNTFAAESLPWSAFALSP